jgi:multifunctional 2-oxoglutarate metabolism enzyme
MSDPLDAPLAYGPNVWLIDEMYRRYSADPASVGERWREFFADYTPSAMPVLLHEGPPRVDVLPVTEPPASPPLPPGAEELRGAPEIVARNMEESLSVPTATSTRSIPVKLLEENRRIINRFLEETLSGKASITHVVAWAILRALVRMPAMTTSFLRHEGRPYKVRTGQINLGIAVDVQKKDGSRGLLVPNIKAAEQLDFRGFYEAYNEVIRRVTSGRITPDDFAGTTVSLTNPGTIGTIHSVPRLMVGQSVIVGTGAVDYPAEWQSADPKTLARLGISKVMMVTSTYDHRVIQGAESGQFLAVLHDLLTGGEEFYDEIFASLRIPYAPVRLARDRNPVFESESGVDAVIEEQARVLQLINMYRVRGHLLAHLNPLTHEVQQHSELDPASYGLTLWDFDRMFITGGLGGTRRTTLREIMDILRDAYCRTIGVEYMHIQDPVQKQWMQQRLENVPRNSWMDGVRKRRILETLNAAEAFEKFLHTRYVGHKRFGLEGAESLIPMLDALLDAAAHSGSRAVVMGMAHRGRLNVLANVLGMSYQKIFREFEGDIDPNSMQGSGDVKYHLGAEGVFRSSGGDELPVTLASNPSHLEAVDPVVEGMVRAMQDRMGDTTHERVLPVLIHGDAAFAGQGVVAETFNLSMLSGYRTGGTVHIVVNNGIGFTTSAHDARSSVYATDVAKMVQAPIFHVNGDDAEACVHVIELALAFRNTFHKDVVVDMICYRRHGHNEGDDPSYTQPLMYAHIREKRSVRKLYTELLVNRGDITLEEAEAALEQYHAQYEQAFDETRELRPPDISMETLFREISEDPAPVPDTGVEPETLQHILDTITTPPAGFAVHPKLLRQLEAKRGTLAQDAVDWATAEALAFGSLLIEGTDVRLSGQDSRRGTFSQRHSVLVEHRTGRDYIPLNALAAGQGRFMPIDSLLSEYAVLGFEYGYATAWKDPLVLWEAQFGDFVNGAQIIVDQFITAAEDKWKQQCGLVMLLPHGFEGQGPEHSSARLERFLILCAESNIRVAIPSTSAQYFHLLRRQAHEPERKPLIVLTPKSLLRADVSKCASAAFSEGRFHYVLDDPAAPAAPTRMLLASGKVAHELMAHRSLHGHEDTVILRLEQMYPFPASDIVDALRKYPKVRDVRWVQEAPRNMGAWNFVYARLRDALEEPYSLTYVGRTVSASPATGSMSIHTLEQEKLLREAFA